MKLSNNYHSMVVTGVVQKVDPVNLNFTLQLLSGKSLLKVSVTKTTWYEVLRNVGDEGRDRVPEPPEAYVNEVLGANDPAADQSLRQAQYNVLKYLRKGVMVSIRGVASEHETDRAFSARRVVLMHSEPGMYGWEQTHWWLQQINTLFEQWMDVLFQDKREITENDFAAFYRTNLDLLGGHTADDIQECATMSRFLYGLSSSYMLTGNDRALSAAAACAKYLINAFAVVSHDHMYCFWKFGRVQDKKSVKSIMSSQNPDDLGSYALYEQIYALAGLTQYYRITQDTNILYYITRTISAFEKFFRDHENRNNDSCFNGEGGYFSHIDPVTMRPDSPALGKNRERKNWNSIGDHIPAYLINLLLAIDPLPKTANSPYDWDKLRQLCRDMLDSCVEDILEHFTPDEDSLFVKERFHANWEPDRTWDWQQDRGIVGHNLKISWNLTRCGHYYTYLAKLPGLAEGTALDYTDMAKKCYEFSRLLGKNMERAGVDLIRGGIFDALERVPQNKKFLDFAWEPTKDFWQQEQAILAYYIMAGIDPKHGDSPRFLELARYCTAFWSLYFVDQDHRKIYFRTDESGTPIVQDGYGVQGGHAIAGYHSFELNFLAHIYIRAYVQQTGGGDDSFCITYRPCKNDHKTLNVLPDFFRPGDLKIITLKFNGVKQKISDPHSFQVDISELAPDTEVVVEFLPGRKSARGEQDIKQERSTIKDIYSSKTP